MDMPSRNVEMSTFLSYKTILSLANGHLIANSHRTFIFLFYFPLSFIFKIFFIMSKFLVYKYEIILHDTLLSLSVFRLSVDCPGGLMIVSRLPFPPSPTLTWPSSATDGWSWLAGAGVTLHWLFRRWAAIWGSGTKRDTRRFSPLQTLPGSSRVLSASCCGCRWAVRTPRQWRKVDETPPPLPEWPSTTAADGSLQLLTFVRRTWYQYL